MPSKPSPAPAVLPEEPLKAPKASEESIKMGARFRQGDSPMYLERINPSETPYRQLFLETEFLDDPKVSFLATFCEDLLKKSTYFGAFIYKGDDAKGDLMEGVQITYISGEKVDITEVNILPLYQRKG